MLGEPMVNRPLRMAMKNYMTKGGWSEKSRMYSWADLGRFDMLERLENITTKLDNLPFIWLFLLSFPVINTIIFHIIYGSTVGLEQDMSGIFSRVNIRIWS